MAELGPIEPEVSGGQEGEGQPDLAFREPGEEAMRLFEPQSEASAIANLVDRYMVPPFSILDRRQGYWQERARQWKGLGIESELGREALLRKRGGTGVYIGVPLSDGQLAGKPGSELSEEEIADRRAGAYGTAEMGATYPKTQRLPPEEAKARQEAAKANTRGGAASVATMNHLTGGNYQGNYNLARNASIFDPVICELAYAWFCPPGGTVVDPFAGGSVRGIVAGAGGRSYYGIDLSEEQVEANREQADRIIGRNPSHGERLPTWVVGDALEQLPATGEFLGPEGADLIFTCPPYGDLEVYSDDPQDLSTMTPAGFRDAYTAIIGEAVRLMAPDSFAAFVVGNYRDERGMLLDLCGLTIRAFTAAGARYYNESIILDPIGTGAVRAPRIFDSARKLVRVHQQMLVFVKGDPKAATRKIIPAEEQAEAEALESEPEPETPQSGPIPTPGPTATSPRVEARSPAPPAPGGPISSPTALTPVERHGDLWLKRDDLFEAYGQPGGKARSCLSILQAAPEGTDTAVTAGARKSPQAVIVSHIAQGLGLRARIHTPSGPETAELEAAREAGAERIEHTPGYNNVICARARKDAEELPAAIEVPFGMECGEHIDMTARQVANLPDDFERLVVCVGAGMSLAGIIRGMEAAGREQPIIGIAVGAAPQARLDRYVPHWREQDVHLFWAEEEYDREVEADIDGIRLDPIYEAKVLPHLRPGDLFWLVGIRSTL